MYPTRQVALEMLVLIHALIRCTSGFKCYSCASPELEKAWHLAGYPFQNGVKSYAASCATPTEVIPTVDCGPTSICVSYITEAFDRAASIDALPVFYVRGCLSALTTVTDPPKDQKCEFGTVLNKGPSGIVRSLKQKVKFCKTADDVSAPCNTENVLSADGCVGDASANRHQCAQCTNEQGFSCNLEQTCEGRWCFTQQLTIGAQQQGRKYCAEVNPFGDAGCRNWTDKTYVPSRMSVDVVSVQCFCETDYCNSGTTTSSSTSTSASTSTSTSTRSITVTKGADRGRLISSMFTFLCGALAFTFARPTPLAD